MHKTQIAVLGPEGTNSEEAALLRWKNPQIKYCEDLAEIFDMVEGSVVDYGVVPTEDSEEGEVHLATGLLRNYDVHVMEEMRLGIIHNLLAKGSVRKIKTVASHTQPLSNCRQYLKTHFPNWTKEAVSSTAYAAYKARQDATVAAIASERSAKIYGLRILRSNIHDAGPSETRFSIIAQEPIAYDGPGKTTIIVDPKENMPGWLHEFTGYFSRRSVNLTRIISKPYRGSIGEYYFAFDFEGNSSDPKIHELLSEIKNSNIIRMMKFVGSYPSQHLNEIR